MSVLLLPLRAKVKISMLKTNEGFSLNMRKALRN